jgi:hypothetical protein
MNLKEYGRKQPWPNLKCYPSFGGNEENDDKPCQNNWPPD